MKLTHIELVFENIEVMRFSAKDVEYFNMSGVTSECSLWNRNNSCEDNELRWSSKCANMQLVLNSRANNMKNWVSDYPDKKMPFERIINDSDITHVELHYAGGRKVSYEMPWKYKDPHAFCPINLMQESSVDDQGMLHVYIGNDFNTDLSEV